LVFVRKVVEKQPEKPKLEKFFFVNWLLAQDFFPLFKVRIVWIGPKIP